ncbi:MAG: hypothetical protein QOH35_3697 [Acidobacteriaceae bacterium]|jgi:hypothetical protein|nr:hypothetical protein [Acidobacteriaceae bacterium]
MPQIVDEHGRAGLTTKVGSDEDENRALVGLTPEETEGLLRLDETEAAPSAGFDNYRGLRDPNLMIFVAAGTVPPFRFKAGGWELLKSSINLGPSMSARVVERGFFMCRLSEDQSGWSELTDLPAADL